MYISGISLLDYSAIVTEQIISWRQFELGCWKECLNAAQNRLKSRASRWWFHLYSMFEKYTNPEDSNEPEKLVESLHKFMNESPLVEFEARLKLIFTFHCHLLYAEPASKKDELVSILWNLYNYYNLLVPQVNARINELKTPIQTGLKNFVKICRWNDISYWSVKETIHKTHKTLHSFVKKFETGLRESVASCFFIKPSFLDAKESQKFGLKIDDFLVPIGVETFDVTVSNELECLKNVSSKTKIAKKLCNETLSRDKSFNLMEDLQTFVEEFMELASELKNTEIDRSLEKSAQKSRAKSILSQKKSSLARYFKDLKEFGVSDRKGILKLRNKEEEVICLNVPPLDLTSALESVRTKKPDEILLSHWEGCDKFYYKSINLLNTLNTTSYPPQKGLSSMDIEKFKGFSADLMVMAHKQRSVLVDTWNQFVGLRKQLDSLSSVDLKTGNQIEIVERSSKSFRNLLVAAKTIFHQLEIYLKSCPNFVEGKRVLTLLKDPLPVESCRKDDEVWNKINGLVQQAVNLVNNISKEEPKILGLLVEETSPDGWTKEKLVTMDHRTCLERCFLKINNLKIIVKELKSFVSREGESHPVSSSLSFLEELIENFTQTYEETKTNKEEIEDSSLIQDFELQLENLLKRRLLVIQSKFKKELQLDSTSLSENLVKPLSKDLRELNLDDFSAGFTSLQLLLSKMSSTSFQHCIKQFSSCLNLFNQYLLLSQFYLIKQVSTLRLTCKILYLQLNVFLELATNGFCIPKDLDVDEEEDGCESSEKGGMGLADGEGEKDVSDRIESEDQLDQAQLPNQEKKEEKGDNNCKEEEKGINMSEDFEGDLQDLEKGEKDDEDESEESDDEEMDKEMNELGEGADQLDEQIWGDDKDETEEEPRENEEDVGKGEQTGEKQMDAKEDGKNDEAKDDKTGNEDEEREQQKEINEMKEPEVNEDQIDPYHGQQREEPEVEPMDLPDDLNLDDQEGKDNEENETENPFDIDEMKESVLPPEKDEPEGNTEDNQNEKGEEEDSSEDEAEEESKSKDNPMDLDEDPESEEGKEVDKEKKKEENESAEKEDQKEEEEGEREEEKALPSVDTASTEKDGSEQTEESAGSKDSVAKKPEDEEVQSPSESAQENDSDKGVGQSQTENQSEGHSGSQQEQVSARVQQGTEVPKNEKRKNPGQADENRSLADDPARKKLKTVILSDDKSGKEMEEEKEGSCEEKESDAYQHVADSEQFDQQAMDAATEDQLVQKPSLDEEDEKVDENCDVEMADDSVPEKEEENEELSSEKIDNGEEKKSGKSKKPSSEKKDTEDESEKVEIEGEMVEMSTVARSAESNFFTNLLGEESFSSGTLEEKRVQVSSMLQRWSSTPTTEEASQAWNTLNSMVDFSARDLSEKLRLILEPTQASRLKGDYRTGRRINMRKIIPYIASQFRKDKIWLRRTKPSKRDYQIVIAIDDSSSMADNQSKELAFESLALISKALTYLESGDLSIVSFGETTNILHPLGEPFTERNGS